jgi:NADH-quinone oxidoreductase subunit A
MVANGPHGARAADFVTPETHVPSGFGSKLVPPGQSARFRGDLPPAATEDSVLTDWLPFLIYAVFAAAIPATMILGSFVFATRPRTRTKQRMLPFESGVSETAPGQQRRFTVSFYLTAMLFILFDVEIVFLYPLAVQLDMLGWFGFAELLVFVAILAVAYVYVWRKGALEWH